MDCQSHASPPYQSPFRTNITPGPNPASPSLYLRLNLTPYERYLAVLRGSRPDILPRLPILMQFAAEHIGSNYGAFASDYHVLVEANLRCAAEFGIDQLNTISDPYRETS